MVDNRTMLDELAKYSNYANALLTAPVSIILSANTQWYEKGEFWEQDMSAATEQMVISMKIKSPSATIEQKKTARL